MSSRLTMSGPAIPGIGIPMFSKLPTTVAMPLLILPQPATIASSLSKRREQKTCWRPSRERAGRRVGAELAVSIRIRLR